MNASQSETDVSKPPLCRSRNALTIQFTPIVHINLIDIGLGLMRKVMRVWLQFPRPCDLHNLNLGGNYKIGNDGAAEIAEALKVRLNF